MFVPLFTYYLTWILDIQSSGNILFDILGGIFAGTFMAVIEGWGLIAYMAYLIAAPVGRQKRNMGFGVIILCIISAVWMYKATEFVFTFAGYWRTTLKVILGLNAVYILGTIIVMCMKDPEMPAKPPKPQWTPGEHPEWDDDGSNKPGV